MVPVPEPEPLPLPEPEPLFDVPLLLEPVLEFELEVVLELDVTEDVPPAHEISIRVNDDNNRINKACFDLPVMSSFSTGNGACARRTRAAEAGIGPCTEELTNRDKERAANG